MKRRRRSIAAGLAIALVGFGGPTTASSSDSFGKKFPPPPPPPRSNHHSKAGFNEEGEGSEQAVGASASLSTTIIPPPPPRHNSYVIPPPRIPPPPPRALESNEALNVQQDQLRLPPPPPPRPIESKSKEDAIAIDISSEKSQTEHEAESKERDEEYQILESNTKSQDIATDLVSEATEESTEHTDSKQLRDDPQTTPNKSDEVTLELENQIAQSNGSMNRGEDTVSFMESRTPETQTTTFQNQEESQINEDAHIDTQETPPQIANDPKPGPEPAFVRSQTSGRRFQDESQSKPNRQAFTMPLTHQEAIQPTMPMQTNHDQHQNQHGSYSNMPNSQRRYPSRVPPANVRRQHPRTAASATSTLGFFKNVLGSVEKGLDELSNMEDRISKRAQKLVSNAASSSGVSNVVQFATKSLSSRASSSSRSSPKRMTGAPSKISPTAAALDKSPFTHLGKKYETATAAKESSQPPATQNLFRANGGASAPGGQTPNQPIPTLPLAANGLATSVQPERRQQQPQPQQYSQSHRHGDAQSAQTNAQGVQSPYGSNPYKQATESQTKSDPHSRQSRIPWEESRTGTSRPGQPQMPAVNSYKEDDVSWKEKLMSALPRLPRLPNPAKLFRFRKNSAYQYANMDAWKDDDDDSRRGLFGFLKKKSSSKITSPNTMPQLRPSSTGNSETTTTPIDSLMARSNGAKTTSLLATSDKAKCRSLGRYYAAFDFVQVMFLILGIQQLNGLSLLTIPSSLLDLVSQTIPTFIEIIRASRSTWAPFWFAYALLTNISRNIMLDSRLGQLASEVAGSVEDNSMYGQLYLRLMAAAPIDTRLLSRLSQAAQSEVKWMIAKARLSSFTTFVAGLLVYMTVSVVRPAMMVVGKTVFDLVTLHEWRSWPIDWKSLWNHHSTILKTSFRSLETLFANVLVKAFENPRDVAFHVAIFTALLLATLIPKIESKKTVPEIDDEDDEIEIANEGLDQISRLGASSATRLTMLSENGSVENVLERWRSLNVPTAILPSNLRLSQIIRKMGYVVLAGLITFSPLLIPFSFKQAPSSPGLHTGLQWDSMLDVSVVLISVFMLVWNTLKQSTLLQTSLPHVKSFLSELSKTMEEIASSNKQQVDLKLSASISANAGLAVRDLWAAHTTKRAWAVRGASLECRNGEVLAILGDDSSGKTRLMTTIAESIISPPKRSRTSNKVRGLVAVGGLDASKWDKPSLKRRLGILLSDVSTLGDTASIFSGWTLEEILEPVDGVQPSPRSLTSSEKSAILLGLKITGLYGSLIRRLPSKMNTVVTGNEEDLSKPSVDPSTTFLSPAEWSKLLLAKVIAQTIADNDNVLASTDKIENSLMGSVLLLDDVTVLLSEIDEAKVIRDLRQTGAATVISSNKWATGRFADRIAIVKDGAIVEVGSHNELIARGPQQSLYAAKWHAMTIG